jgi:hypothetical protein
VNAISSARGRKESQRPISVQRISVGRVFFVALVFHLLVAIPGRRWKYAEHEKSS